MATKLILNSIEILEADWVSNTADLDQLFLLVDGKIGLMIDHLEVCFEDKPLQNLFLLKNALTAAFFGETMTGDLELPSFLSGDLIKITSIDIANVEGEISTDEIEAVAFKSSTLELAKDVGNHMRLIKKKLLNRYPELDQNWPTEHLFGGIQF